MTKNVTTIGTGVNTVALTVMIVTMANSTNQKALALKTNQAARIRLAEPATSRAAANHTTIAPTEATVFSGRRKSRAYSTTATAAAHMNRSGSVAERRRARPPARRKLKTWRQYHN